MINSIGLPNRGLAGYLEHDLPALTRLLPVPLIVNVMGTSREDVARLVAAVAERPEVAALELNVSCPNVHSGLTMGADPRETEALVRHVRPLTAKPLIVKLTPSASSPPDVAAAAEAAGADAVSLINTLRALALAPARRSHDATPAGAAPAGGFHHAVSTGVELAGGGAAWLGGGSGGLSGPAIRTIALAQVAQVAARVSIPIVGMGGVQRTSHARDLLAAGATLVAVGTETFRDPLAAARIAAELTNSSSEQTRWKATQT